MDRSKELPSISMNGYGKVLNAVYIPEISNKECYKTCAYTGLKKHEVDVKG